MKIHLIENAIVVNTIDVESVAYAQALFPNETCVEGTIDSANGWVWDGSKLNPATPNVPQFITLRQARLELLRLGLLDSVNIAINSMTGTIGAAARIEWEYSSNVDRYQPLVAALGGALGLTDKQLDDLFIAASIL